LAQALVQLVPVASQLFTTNITAQSMAIVLWDAQGTPIGQSCGSQVGLIDVGSVLDSNVSPNRTQWAEAALLWFLFQSGDIHATQDLQSSVEKLPFQSLQGNDGPETDPSNKFNISISGFTFNFAAQTVTPLSLTFQNDGSPSSAQLGEVNSAVKSSLDRMYTFASGTSFLPWTFNLWAHTPPLQHHRLNVKLL